MKKLSNSLKNKRLIAYVSLAIIFISHILAMISLYPGIAYYDIGTQIEQYTSGNFNTSHPLLHTLFIGYFSQAFEGNTGFAIATLIQLIIVDTAIGYMLIYVYSRLKNIILHLIFVAFFAFMPMCSFLTISHTKDILFAAFALIFVIDILRFRQASGPKTVGSYIFMARMVVNIILMLLLRNNAVYAFIAALIILWLAYLLSKSRKKDLSLLIVLSLALLLAVISNTGLIKATGAVNGSIKEMMSIPSQIMARVYINGASDSEKETILKYIEAPEDYNYYLSDPIKKQLHFDTVDSECKHFLLDTGIIALHHPIVTCQAILYNIQGYFDPVHCPYSSDHFYLVALEYRGGAKLEPRWWSVFDFYHKWFYQSEALSHSPFIIFFNMALYIWLYLISFIFVLKKKDRDKTISYIFPLLYLATLLLGPGAIIRYGYLYILLLPVSYMNMRS